MDLLINNDIRFIKNSKIISLNPNNVESTIDECNDFILNDSLKNITLYTGTEIFINKDCFNKIQDYCNQKNKNGIKIKILTSTFSKINNGFNPLVNLICWNSAKHHSDNCIIFNSNNYKHIKKNKKFILSWRKFTSERNNIICNLNDIKIDYDNSIFNFHKTLPDKVLNQKLHNISNDLIEWNDLINLYNESYISFIAETEYWISTDVIDDELIIPNSEKILIPFLSRNLPIVYASNGYIQNLKNNGLFVLNDYFGVKEFDIDSYSKCITHINSLTLQEVKNIYRQHLFEINKNYETVSRFILKPFWFIEHGKVIKILSK